MSQRAAVPIMRSVSRGLLRIVPPALWVVLTLLVLPLFVAASTYRGLLELVALGVAGVAGIVFTIVRPRVMLSFYVALIPLEATLVIGEAATVTRAVGAVFFAGYLLRRFGRLHLGTVPLIGWAALVWAVASLIWALDRTVASDALFTLAQLFAMMVVVADFVGEEPQIVRPLLIVYTVAATATALIALGGSVLGGGALGEDRLGAFDTQDVAQFAALLVPAFFFLLVELLERRRLVVSTAGILLIAAAIVLSGTRSAWLAIGVGAAVIILPRIGRRGLVPVVLLALAVIALFTIDELRGIIADRLATALSSGGAGRIDIWSVGLNIVSDHPLLGVGYGNFPVAFTPEVIRDTNVPGLDINVLFPGAGPHSIVIGTVAELGIIGAALMLPFFVITLLGRGTGPSWPVVQATLLALLAQALFLDVLNRKHFWLVMALALGLIWRAAHDRATVQEAELEVREEFAQRIRNTWAPTR